MIDSVHEGEYVVDGDTIQMHPKGDKSHTMKGKIKTLTDKLMIMEHDREEERFYRRGGTRTLEPENFSVKVKKGEEYPAEEGVPIKFFFTVSLLKKWTSDLEIQVDGQTLSKPAITGVPGLGLFWTYTPEKAGTVQIQVTPLFKDRKEKGEAIPFKLKVTE
jgi:hypothetical protein